MPHYFHSVTLDSDKCKGCTNCIKGCPTEAIRVRNGKAKIIKERCIDCGECIKVCPYHAKLAVTDDFSMLKNFKYTIALPAPALYGQFKNTPHINVVLTGLKKIGFDNVYEVAKGAELVSFATREMMENENLKLPVISSACPAIMRLINVRFPGLIGNVINLLAPMEVAAREAKEEVYQKYGYKEEEVGVFFITPCPAKVTSIRQPIGLEKSYVDGAISLRDVYIKLLPTLKKINEPENLMSATYEGIGWARNGGECEGTDIKKHIAVDGVNNVIKILEAIEDDKLDDIDFIELSACLGGCVGGALNIENSFVASTRIKNMLADYHAERKEINRSYDDFKWQKPLDFLPEMKLDDDFNVAFEKMARMEKIYESLPKLDCGSCGAPSCRALAEDVVRGFATETACIFNMRDKVRELAKELFELEGKPFGQ